MRPNPPHRKEEFLTTKYAKYAKMILHFMSPEIFPFVYFVYFVVKILMHPIGHAKQQWRKSFLNSDHWRMRHRLFALLLVWVAAGCASPPPDGGPRPPGPAPAEGLVTQRAVLTLRGRQFALNGYLAQSATAGRRLIITETFGPVLADVLVKPDGTVRVLRSSRLLRPAWIGRYVAADMQCIFGAPDAASPARQLSASHFVIERRWYKLDLQIVETKPGPQPPELFDPARPEQP